MPPNKIRLSILGAMIVLSILAVLVDGVLPGELKGMFFDMQIITKHAVWIVLSTCIAAIINLGIDLILIHQIGIFAASISTLISCAFLALYRMYDVQKIQKISYDMSRFIKTPTF